MITTNKGGYPTDEEIWEQMPQEMKDKILQGYVEGYHSRKGGGDNVEIQENR